MKSLLRLLVVASSILHRNILILVRAEEACQASVECGSAELVRSSRSLLQKAVRSNERSAAALELADEAYQSPSSTSSPPLRNSTLSSSTSSPPLRSSTPSSSTSSPPLRSSTPSSSTSSPPLRSSTPSSSTSPLRLSSTPSSSTSSPPLRSSTPSSSTSSPPLRSSTPPMANCTGFFAQGKCWFLSERGESCAATCAKNYRSFAFALANKEDPILPNLLSRDTLGGKLQPWAALECYVESEDHWHPANDNAAKHYFGNIGAWTNTACRLACPCGEADTCRWKQPPACAPEFEWMGVWYTGCTSVDNDRPWCQHHHQHTDREDVHADDWSNCVYSCAPDTGNYAVEDGCSWKPASTCIPEFDYEGTHYVGCTATDYHTPWCSNTDPYSGSWNHCTYGCVNSTNTTNATTNASILRNATDIIEKLNNETAKDDTLCYWQPKPECARSFSYKGVDYFGCTYEDHPTPWCSLDRIHRGFFSVCTRVCNASAPSASNTSSTTIAATMLATAATTTASLSDAPATSTKAPNTTTLVTSTEAVATSSTASTAPTTAALVVTTSSLPRTTIQDKPCDRHPETENDSIGQTAALDEAGYQVTAERDSPINMKRFICRVVDKIDCEVNDVAALYGFVPYYSGTVSHQTYQHLEDELKILCHAGGKWVQAKPGYE